ncbi:uncharacterized protein Z520_04759 [Fonsecaea multimorphosa CBS 102226]|uniref:CENP-C homolog n=1 Tax=Fonsecaea multimorphosa CBS 102226 TaxID=1442371 RepID=A0A0D2KR44_9EURO|nr:uncharacterized protein Z520_04759 [Fonsecaea multimorphosa CBS 102226]KIX99183.1 hypothetical protein Z520_04759 [Fonsecaea multimorphosa CBS 102226]OAL25880.1 hypothetical protein AYO22_04507 [Fonsecaea multimorphosa]
MASRPAVRRERGNVDYSAIGKLGRRTGVTLDHRPLDANGMEEISGIFSSPRKPSPLKNVIIVDRVEESGTMAESPQPSSPSNPGPTPSQALSSRSKSRATPVPLPRSSSPRKSGVSGAARKSNGVDIFSTRKSLQPEGEGAEDRENMDEPTPTRLQPMLPPTRFNQSPQRLPLRDITTPPSHKPSKPRPSLEMQRIENEVYASVEDEAEEVEPPALSDADLSPPVEPTVAPPAPPERHLSAEASDAYVGFDGAEGEQEQEPKSPPSEVIQNKANSRKKRKSDLLEEDDKATSPVPKKARKKQGRIPARQETTQHPSGSFRISPEAEAVAEVEPPPRDKGANLKLSARQQKELDEIVEKVKARPGPPRSLYILRRETPTDDGVTHTRSGRASVRPLAYWRNERCVYGASPRGGGLADGARFPLNSIKEIVRIEEIEPNIGKKKSKSKRKNEKGKGKGKGKARQKAVEESEESDSEFDMDEIPEDPDAEPWETGTGTLRGNVAIWDNEEQAPTEQQEEVEIAHAPAAIKTREVKGSSSQDGASFRYAKLLSTRFFGTGLVDLPPGGLKRPKNSRKMHMSFFVVKGRVTVTVGPPGGEETGSMNRFSIGKGGFWQVPRGNQYSIENEMEKPARIFFSQGCEPAPVEEQA